MTSFNNRPLLPGMVGSEGALGPATSCVEGLRQLHRHQRALQEIDTQMGYRILDVEGSIRAWNLSQPAREFCRLAKDRQWLLRRYMSWNESEMRRILERLHAEISRLRESEAGEHA